ncbi:MAG: 23S rRNA (adenine(2503)-C(2))-methyltransferase RlmN [Halobacteriovoraceae bacterium]|nr:23S rRNA (adenine(2503)-C(2))-methyltransferase RlmN [Halobacteriovoraceae bacterium]
MKKSLYGIPYFQLEKILKSNGLNPSGASLLFNHLYKKLSQSITLENLSQRTQEYLKENYSLKTPKVTNVQKVEDGEKVTRKFLVSFEDNLEVECVLIPFQNKFTLCLSSQVGCAMGCSFCYTGTQGLKRNLETSEIVGQLMAVKHWLKENHEDCKISNLVFMGQGEPLHNFEAVREACEIFLSQYGLSFGREKITISTAGYLPGLKDWSADPLNVNLALSFHCPEDETRSELIPLNKPYPLKEVLEEIAKIPLEKKRFVTFEVLLIDNLNDSADMAKKTGEMLKDFSPLVNIIPFNPIPGSPYRKPKRDAVDRYKEIVEGFGIPTMVRRTKGDEILAACGQLKS